MKCTICKSSHSSYYSCKDGTLSAMNLSSKQQRQLMKEADEALAHGKAYQSVEELHADILQQ
ncbi:MAG: hypothetical protein WC813_02250 [Patescibacteria group bacterium]|jgi:hypothetical protein